MILRVRAFVASEARAAALLRAVVGSAGLRLLGMALGFLVGVQLARGLRPEGYGVYGIAMSTIAVLMVPTEFGLPLLITREIAAAQVSGNRMLMGQLLRWSTGFVFVNASIVASLGGVAIWSGVVHPNGDLAPSLLWGVALLPIVAMGNIYGAALRGLHRVVEGQLPDLLIRPAVYSILLLLASSGLSSSLTLTPATAMALNVVSSLAALAFAGLRIYPQLAAAQSYEKTEQTGRRTSWLTSALPLALSDGMRIVGANIGILLLGAVATDVEVGLCRVALAIYTVATLPSAIVNISCSPMLARLHEEGNRVGIGQLNAWISAGLVACALVCIVPFATVGHWLIGTVFGLAFADANAIVLTLLVGEFLAALLGHPVITLNMMREERAVLRFSALAFLVNCVVCTLGAWRWGGVGIALGVSASQLSWRVCATYYARRRLHLDTSILGWFGRSTSS